MMGEGKDAKDAKDQEMILTDRTTMRKGSIMHDGKQKHGVEASRNIARAC
jgi:hypothetical protein